jgi:ferric-dicitrate binding protein FerR (iron transport regulator)
MAGDPVIEVLTRLTEAFNTQATAFQAQRQAHDAQRDVLMELARAQQLSSGKRGLDSLPPLDPEDPNSRLRRLHALALSVKAFAAGLGVDLLSAHFPDGVALTWDAPDLKIAGPDGSHFTLEDLERKLFGAA